MSTKHPVSSNSAIEKKILRIVDQTLRAYSMIQDGNAVQMAVNVPSSIHIAQLREEFMELSDRLNLDAILEPVKS